MSRNSSPDSGSSESVASTTEVISREKFQDILEKNKEEIPHRGTLDEARTAAEKLLLAQSISSSYEESKKIVDRYLDVLIASMKERKNNEGSAIKQKYADLSQRVLAMKGDLDRLGFTEPIRKSIEGIIDHFQIPDEGEIGKGKHYLTVWNGRYATNGILAQSDYPIFKSIVQQTPKGTAERAFLDTLHLHMLELRKMDQTNMTFLTSTPTLTPGTRFAFSCLLAGISLFSFLMARKSGKIPKKGLIALGLLLYINRNGTSKLSYLTTGRYEKITEGLRGSPEGEKILEAFGQMGNRESILQFAKREKIRTGTEINDPRRTDLPTREESYTELGKALGLGKNEQQMLQKMPFNDITELASELQKLTPEELGFATTMNRRSIGMKDIASIPIAKEETTPKG